MLLDLLEGLKMPFFLPFFIFMSVIYANTIEIDSKFSEIDTVCIYNAMNTSLTIKLKSENDSNNQVCLKITDFSGVLDEGCDTGSVEIDPDGLREKTIYYVLRLSAQNDDDYNLTIEGDEDGMMASECPEVALAKVSNTTSDFISMAMVIAGVLSAIIFFGAIALIFVNM